MLISDENSFIRWLVMSSDRAIVGKRFTIVVPKSIRNKVPLKEGQQVVVSVDKGKLVIEPLSSDPLKVLERVIGEPYREAKDEKRAERWAIKHASP
jgi:AbrB family looped-hinge helix DNA binding protein